MAALCSNAKFRWAKIDQLTFKRSNVHMYYIWYWMWMPIALCPKLKIAQHCKRCQTQTEEGRKLEWKEGKREEGGGEAKICLLLPYESECMKEETLLWLSFELLVKYIVSVAIFSYTTYFSCCWLCFFRIASVCLPTISTPKRRCSNKACTWLKTWKLCFYRMLHLIRSSCCLNSSRITFTLKLKSLFRSPIY